LKSSSGEIANIIAETIKAHYVPEGEDTTTDTTKTESVETPSEEKSANDIIL